MTQWDYRTARKADWESLLELQKSFTYGNDTDTTPWLEAAGLDNIRVLEASGTLGAMLIVIPMGQWFGGRSLPMAGIAGVTVAREARGKGAASTLMAAYMRELNATQVPISTLYPASVELYRRSGFELSGGCYRLSAPLRDLRGIGDPAAVRRLGPDDWAAIQRTHRLYGARNNGVLDRGENIWNRVRKPRWAEVSMFGVDGADGLDGYAIVGRCQQGIGSAAESNLVLSDLVSLTPKATQSLLALLGSDSSNTSKAVWRGSPSAPAWWFMADPNYEVGISQLWMLRIVHLKAALEGRGYPKAITARLDLEVNDPLVEGNNGCFTLEVAHGSARLASGGNGSFRVDIRGLAPLFAGFQSAEMLVASGLVEAPAEDLSTASALFAGAPPFMTQPF